jgi:hypothetical protein
MGKRKNVDQKMADVSASNIAADKRVKKLQYNNLYHFLHSIGEDKSINLKDLLRFETNVDDKRQILWVN